MGIYAMKFSFILFVAFVVLLLFGSVCCIKYNTGAGIVENKLNIHLVPHSHDDVGWLKNVDQYYVGSNATTQVACVENVLDSVVEALRRDPNRKFVFAEQAFFQRWWATQEKQVQDDVRKLVDAGQLEFVNGGWCMHDEATTHYIDMIDQTTLGHRFIKQQFNKTPRAGWQIDPFGHSAVQAYLLGAELGFDSVHFARIDYQDRQKREGHKTLETIWQGSKSFGSSSQIFTNVFPVDYGPPQNFHFSISDEHSPPIQDNPLLYDNNVQQRVQDFFNAAMTQANLTRTNHIMWTMGGDFEYLYAETWFKQMDKLIHHVNKDGRVNALYSTPSIYTDAKYAANCPWPLKTDDYFPYADAENSYWTGYFTSRPAFKRYVRALSGYYLAARQLEFLSGRKIGGPTTYSLGDALGIAQHHDAVSGTAKQHTTDDYMKRLAAGASEAEAVTNVALSSLVNAKPGVSNKATSVAFGQCQLLNISYCPSTEEDIPDGKSLVMVAYNPLGWNQTEVIRIPVANADLVVHDASGTMVEAQFIVIDNVTVNLRNYYTKIYLGNSPKNVPKYWLYFSVSVPPLGWSTYFISKNNAKGDTKISYEPVLENQKTKNVVIGPGKLKMSFSSSGDLIQMSNSEIGVNLPIQQNILWYAGNEGSGQPPGAYVFRPAANPSVAKIKEPIKVVHGTIVDEIHQHFDSWIYLVTRLYKDREHAEIEYTIGPVPSDDYSGKEVITRMKTKMTTNKEFYTDSNGRDFLKRIRDHREDWSLSVNEPVAGNYYPINLGTYINDSSHEFSVLVDRATGGSSINDGEIELMLHRRLSTDDGKGLSESLDEPVCASEGDCQGLTVRGNYYMGIHKLGAGAKWRRTTGQKIYSPFLFAFTHEHADTWKASRSTKTSSMDSNYNLPPSVALVTLQELEDKTVLLRLAHLYEAGEDKEHSRLARVELKKMFSGKQIKEAKEMNLSANQEKLGMRPSLVWKVEGQSNNNKNNNGKGVRGSPLNSATFVVELAPMEIRTFLLKF